MNPLETSLPFDDLHEALFHAGQVAGEQPFLRSASVSGELRDAARARGGARRVD